MHTHTRAYIHVYVLVYTWDLGVTGYWRLQTELGILAQRGWGISQGHTAGQN